MWLALRAFTLLGVASCTACVGLSNEGRVKSKVYSFAPPAAPWRPVDAGTADIAFQNPADRATISLNSVCGQYQELSLPELLKGVPLGLDSGTERSRETIEVAGLPALRASTQGMLGGKAVSVTLTVLRGRSCVFDFLLASRSATHAAHMDAYAAFLAGFRARETP